MSLALYEGVSHNAQAQPWLYFTHTLTHNMLAFCYGNKITKKINLKKGKAFPANSFAGFS